MSPLESLLETEDCSEKGSLVIHQEYDQDVVHNMSEPLSSNERNIDNQVLLIWEVISVEQTLNFSKYYFPQKFVIYEFWSQKGFKRCKDISHSL